MSRFVFSARFAGIASCGSNSAAAAAGRVAAGAAVGVRRACGGTAGATGTDRAGADEGTDVLRSSAGGGWSSPTLCENNDVGSCGCACHG